MLLAIIGACGQSINRSPTITVERGIYTVGCLDATLCGTNRQRTVTTNRFDIDVYEATEAEYERCVDAGGCPKSDVARVGSDVIALLSYSQADSYCRWKGGRVPKDAEWEIAIRRDRGLFFPWGNVFAADCLATADGTGHGATFRFRRSRREPCLSVFGIVGAAGTYLMDPLVLAA